MSLYWLTPNNDPTKLFYNVMHEFFRSAVKISYETISQDYNASVNNCYLLLRNQNNVPVWHSAHATLLVKNHFEPSNIAHIHFLQT